MLALIGNLHVSEILIILVVALIVFGERLPEVAMRGAAQLVKLRRTVSQMWREAGLEDELRRVRREMEDQIRKVPAPRQVFDEFETMVQEQED